MKSRYYLVFFLVLVLVSCQLTTKATVLTPPQPSTLPLSTVTVMAEQPTSTVASTSTPIASISVTPAEGGLTLPIFTIDWTQPFPGRLETGEDLVLTTWLGGAYAGKDFNLPLNLDQIYNVHVLDGLTSAEKDFLAKNGFVVVHSQEAQFGDIRVETADKTGQPYYLTTDVAFHALHLLFDDMLKAVEREYFRPQMIAITQATLDEVNTALASLQGTVLQGEAQQSLAYLSVAMKLFDSSARIDPLVANQVNQQVDQIMAAGGKAKSILFPDFEDDYGAYKPTGHYAGDPELEAYFRGMTWFGRMHFLLQNPADPAFKPSRVPLIITLALRRAQLEGQPASDAWSVIHQTLTFVVGPSDDAGPLEYAALMDQVYGKALSYKDLVDDTRWQNFLAQTDQLPSPQINSLFVASTIDLNPDKGWRFMGQRFTLDGLIIQNVIFDRVEAKSDGTRRQLPSGLDVMSAFGSTTAEKELAQQGITQFPNYSDQMSKMQQAVQAQPEAQWLARFYDGWLYSFLPMVKIKDTSYPAYMQTSAWGYKDLNTTLGSWAELKHDTILYTKMPEMAGGGGPPMSGPAPSYVEPNPTAFYRMAYMAQALSCGLQDRILRQPCSSNGVFLTNNASSYIVNMFRLGTRLNTLGDIAAKELAGQPITDEDNESITSCLGMIECVNLATDYSRPESEMPKVPVIAAVSGSDQSVLEVGVGGVDRIYVAVPLENQWQVAQGGVFSYYEFTQPRDQRLTDDEWRAMLAKGSTSLPSWAVNFVQTGGQPTEWLAFRKGDVYIITEAGDKLNVRNQADLNGAVLGQLKTDDYVTIIDGPVAAGGYTWWKIHCEFCQNIPDGWAVENQDWYARSYLH